MRGSCIILLIGLLALPVACVGSRANPSQVDARFDEAEYAAYAEAGTASITGQAYLRLADGRSVFAAGDEVRLVPSTAYTRELIEKQVVQEQQIDAVDVRLAGVTRKAWGDGMGFFDFRDLPAGDYIIVCEIDWQERSPYGLSTDSLTVHRAVSLDAGERVELLVLTR